VALFCLENENTVLYMSHYMT